MGPNKTFIIVFILSFFYILFLSMSVGTGCIMVFLFFGWKKYTFCIGDGISFLFCFSAVIDYLHPAFEIIDIGNKALYSLRDCHPKIWILYMKLTTTKKKNICKLTYPMQSLKEKFWLEIKRKEIQCLLEQDVYKRITQTENLLAPLLSWKKIWKISTHWRKKNQMDGCGIFEMGKRFILKKLICKPSIQNV